MDSYRIEIAKPTRYGWLIFLSLTIVSYLLAGGSADAAPGDLDTGFGTDGRVTTLVVTGVRNNGEQMALQADGKIVVAGTSGIGSSPIQFAVARLNTDGTMDTDFGSNPDNPGTVAFSFDTGSGGISQAYAVAIQNDGKIVVAGESGTTNARFSVARLNTNGSFDEDFGSDPDLPGRVLFQFETGRQEKAFGVAIQPDGKIVVAGGTGIGSGNGRFAAARLNPDGTLDTDSDATPGDFNGTGKLILDAISSNNDQANAVVLQADGKIVLVGSSNIGSTNLQEFAAVRLNADGTPDSSFGSDPTTPTGTVTTPVTTGSNDGASAVVIQSDGKIVAAGFAGTPGLRNTDFALVRWNPDGSLDTSFGSGAAAEPPTVPGTVTIPISSQEDEASGVGIQSDGKVVAAGFQARGTTNANFALVRLNGDGSLNTSFSGDGRTDTAFSNFNDAASWMAIQPDGKIVAAGSRAKFQSNAAFAVARYLGDTGGLDASFGINGRVTTDFGGPDDGSAGVAVHADGRIVAAGFSIDPADPDSSLIAVAQYTPTGTVEVSRADAIPATNKNRAHAVAIQDDGKTVIVGSATPTAPGGNAEFALIRYEDDGFLTADSTFNAPNGYQTTNLSGSDTARAVVLQEDRKIVVGGASDTETADSNFALARYHADGSVDFTSTVDSDTGSNTIDRINGLALQSDGKIVAAGYTDRNGDFDFALIRFLSDGSLDSSFGIAGIVVLDFSLNDRATAVLVQADDKIIAAGVSNEFTPGGPGGTGGSTFAIARFTVDGDLDPFFGSAGKTTISVSQADDIATSAALQSTGKIIIAGIANVSGQSTTSNSEFASVRLNPDGTLDTTFGDGGQILTGFGLNKDDGAQAVAVLANNNIITAGFAETGSPSDFALAQYSSFISGGSPPPAGDGGETDGGGCFIAMAAYGSPLASHVRALRQFRDRFLLPHPIGHKLVRYYYRYSPPVADAIASQDTVRQMVGTALVPLVGLSWFATTVGRWGMLSAMFICVAGYAAWTFRKRKSIAPTLE